MLGCCVPGCPSSTWDKKPKLYRIPFSQQSSFERNRRRLWLEALKCTHFAEDEIRASRVCGAHFISGEMSLDRHSPDFVPSVFPKEKRVKKPNMNPDFVPSVPLVRKDKKNKQPNMKTDEVPVPNKRKKEITKEIVSHSPEVATISRTKFFAGRGIELEWPEWDDLKMQYRLLQSAYTDLQAEVDTLSAANERLKEDLHRVLPRFSYNSVKGDDEQLQFLTGLHWLVFDWLVSQVTAKIDRVLPELVPRDHILMILMKLKLGLCDTDLAYRFGIPEDSVTRICQTWLPALAALLKPLIVWPSARITSKCRPSVFKGKFRNCRCIIDCPEFTVDRVGEDEVKQQSTVKYFASVTPAGAVSFLSSRYKSFIQERRIIEESGFVHLVEPQDEILANGSILIKDELACLGVVLHVPEPNNGKPASKRDAEKQYGHVWTHVKKVSEWWKEFHMLQKVIQVAYADLLDEILIVCAVLTNVNLSLAPKGNSLS